MIDIKNISVRLNNIIPNLTKKIKLVKNRMYYVSAFAFICVFIIPTHKCDAIEMEKGNICVGSSQNSFTNANTNVNMITLDLNMDFESEMIEEIELDPFENMPELKITNELIYYHEALAYDYTEEEFQQICKIAYLEAGGITEEERYIDSMAVVSVILNRIEDERWSSLGSTPLEQIYAEGQFASLKASLYLDYDTVPDYTKQAVADCLGGVRNNDYVSFRAKENTGKNRAQLVSDGNNYFGKMNKSEIVLIKK